MRRLRLSGGWFVNVPWLVPAWALWLRSAWYLFLHDVFHPVPDIPCIALLVKFLTKKNLVGMYSCLCCWGERVLANKSLRDAAASSYQDTALGFFCCHHSTALWVTFSNHITLREEEIEAQKNSAMCQGHKDYLFYNVTMIDCRYSYLTMNWGFFFFFSQLRFLDNLEQIKSSTLLWFSIVVSMGLGKIFKRYVFQKLGK